jgi:preprotein translocase subunit SecA
VQRLFRVQLVPEAMAAIEQRPRPQRMVESHAEVGAFAGAPAPASGAEPPESAGAAQPAGPRLVPLKAGPRVGRNDPCPCGSGKKYKRCHMLIDEGVGSER